MKVLVTTIPFAEKCNRPIDLLQSTGIDYVINPIGRKLTEEDLVKLIGYFDIVIAGTEPITEYVMSMANRLKLIVRVGIGLDNINLLAARERNIHVSYTPDAPSPAVSEMTIGLMLSLLRSTYISNEKMHHGEWYRFFGRRLSEVTIGIIGVGRIGSRVVRHLSGFECRRILINDIRTTIKAPDHPSGVVEWADKDVIYQNADVISLHVPLTYRTRNLLSKTELKAMKSDALLINTSRGGIINERDLFEVLDSGHLGGVALDVFEDEPYSGPLKMIDRCLLTSHMGSMSIDCRTQMEVEATEEVIRYVSGKPLQNVAPDFEYESQLSRV